MREVVLDTETTGLSPGAGHRIVEIGCLELVNHMPTDQVFHTYLDPERPMPAEAQAIHGLGDDFLSGQPRFAAKADEFMAFIANATLVIHNAEFDLGFLNAELARLDRPAIDNQTIDTVRLARKRFPGAQASLDALCRRFNIDNSARTKHGALLDAELLAEVYLELVGGRQPGLSLAAEAKVESTSGERAARQARIHEPSAAELAAHESFLEKIEDPIWKR